MVSSWSSCQCVNIVGWWNRAGTSMSPTSPATEARLSLRAIWVQAMLATAPLAYVMVAPPLTSMPCSDRIPPAAMLTGSPRIRCANVSG